VKQRMVSFDLDTDEVEDQLVRTADKMGKFTVKSAVKLLRPTEDDAVTDWKWMWKFQIPQHLKLFLWLLLHGKLLTDAERFRRRISTSPLCDFCQEGVENMEHLFQNCPAATEVWRELQARGLSYLAGEETFHLWVNRNLRTFRDNPDWPMEFMVTLWYIWKWRCTYCLGGTQDRPSDSLFSGVQISTGEGGSAARSCECP